MAGASVVEPDAIVLFAKAPVPGKVKTRLAASIGDQAAADLHRAFLADLAQTVASRDAAHYLALAGDEDHPGFDPYREADFTFIDQGGGDLGDRLASVTRRLFELGHQRVVIIGSDSPTLGDEHFDAAFSALEDHDIALGPSFDGGYYLIGLSKPHLGVFERIDWSTRAVAEQTLRRCRELDLLWDLLGFWYDIDTIEDLDILRLHFFGQLAHLSPKLTPHTEQALRRLSDDATPEH